jgi:hypothetical protein
MTFLGNQRLPSYSTNSHYFTKAEGSLLHSQELATGPYPAPNESSSYPHCIPIRSVLILSFNFCLHLPSDFYQLNIAYKELKNYLECGYNARKQLSITTKSRRNIRPILNSKCNLCGNLRTGPCQI